MLFRRQALEAKRNELYGEVLIATPLAFKILAAFFVALIAGALAFVSLTSFARVERVPGAVVPSRGIVNVRVSSAGVLTELDLEEGQQVESSQVVGRIVANPVAMDENSERGARLDAIERKLANLEHRIQQTERLSELIAEGIERRIRDLSGQIDRKVELKRLQERMLAETRKAFERTKRASGMKIIRADALTTSSVRMIRAEKDLQRLESEIASLEEELGRREFQQEESRMEHRLKRLELESKRENLESERRILRREKAFSVTVPTSGRVTAVLMSEGSNIDGSRPIFSILPEGSRLEAELYVPSKAIGFVEEGQDVRLLLDAFPYERFGAQKGVVRAITDSVILPSDQDFLSPRPQAVNQPVYKVTVSLANTRVEANDRSLPMRPGMLLSANIILEERSILSWILQPVYAVLRRS